MLILGSNGEGALDRDVVAMRPQTRSVIEEVELKSTHRCTLTLTSDFERPGSSIYQIMDLGRTTLEVRKPSACIAIEPRDGTTRRAHTSMQGVTLVKEKV
jgi:hypothetical protein